MHTFGEAGVGVPAFLAKLWRLVEDPDTNNLICWSKDGRSFIIQNQAQFARELLPQNYKHNNMASFIRQLNMYGFHKITSIENGGLKFDRDEMEFSHPCFKRNCAYLLEHIKRKIANTKNLEEKSTIKPEAVSRILQDVKTMRGRQDSLDSRFSAMRQENEVLWREIASLRQKHAKQQQIVNKLIQFLITIVQPSRNMSSVKRHMQLMINDTPENGKLRKTSETESECGPVIHELGEELLDEIDESDSELIGPNSPYVNVASVSHGTGSPSIERPHSSISLISQNYDYCNEDEDELFNDDEPTTTTSGKGKDDVNKIDKPGSSIIQTVNSDGTEVVYHVTEMPDAHPTESSKTTNYNEENVLTTPMVREEMARSQTLKEKNKQRRKEINNLPKESTSNSVTAAKIQRTVPQTLLNMPSLSPANTNLATVKTENLDTMEFLKNYTNNQISSSNPTLITTQINDDSQLKEKNPNSSFTTAPKASAIKTPLNLYNPDEFMMGAVPSDIFEESSILSGNNSNFSDNYSLAQQKDQQASKELTPDTMSGKFLQMLAENNSNTDGGKNINVSEYGASTSAAAAAAAAEKYTSDLLLDSNKKRSFSQGKNENNMTVAKYTNTNNGDNMRDDVSGHLESVQDELDSLKDLLRSDGYSFDANTLLNLFSDADILNSYGLAMGNENQNEKKGSELMTYQPVYDLSDIIDINNQNEFENENNTTVRPSTSRRSDSVLNTPRHE